MDNSKPKTRPGRNGGTLTNGGPMPGAGRPRKLPGLNELIDEVLGEVKKVNGSDMTAIEAVLRSLVVQAAKGNVQAAKILLERSYGMPKQTIEHSGAEGQPLYASPPSIQVTVLGQNKALDSHSEDK